MDHAQRYSGETLECRIEALTGCFIPVALELLAAGKTGGGFGRGPYINEAMEVAESTLTCIMGREAAYSGQKITWEMIMNSKQDLLPKNFDMRTGFPPTPLPVPGVYRFV